MSPLTTGLARIAKRRSYYIPWRILGARCYSATPASADDPQWFQTLRTEMLSRPTVTYHEHVNVETDDKLAHSLRTFLPLEWVYRRSPDRPIIPLGHSLVWFNTAMPVDKLLPDGTDPLQSPGGPWTRRMWAGGSMEMNASEYYDRERGFIVDSDMICAERIQDVRLRGEGDAAKIFVTLHRRFAQWGSLRGGPGRQDAFGQELLSDAWGNAILKEERKLVFLKDKTAAEHEAVKTGHYMPVKYLESPGNPDFSHVLTPTRSLLFRYSALTFNAHLIHLDREYARTIEGHRNLLVHGPLAQTLMLHAISGHVKTTTNNSRIVESIRYRNLAPLYCDEEMRICGTMKSSQRDGGSVYDIWIEGPTGGVAVKGTVRTALRPEPSSFRLLHVKSIDPYQSATHPEQRRATELSGASNTMSNIDVALGLDDSEQPNHGNSSNSVVPAPKFSRRLTPLNASRYDTPPANSDATKRDSRADQFWRHVQTLSIPDETEKPSNSQQIGKVSTTSEGIVKPSRRDRSLGSARQSSADAVRTSPTSRSHRHNRFGARGIRMLEKPSIKMVGEPLTPPSTASARYALSRRTLERRSHRTK